MGAKPGMFLAVQNREPELTSRFCISRAQIVKNRDARDVSECIGLRHMVCPLADHEDKFRLVIECSDPFGPRHVFVLAAHRVNELDKPGRLRRYFGQHLIGDQFLAVLARIFADAKEFRRIRNGRQKPQRIERPHKAVLLGSLRYVLDRGERRIARGQRRLHRRSRDMPVQLVSSGADVHQPTGTQDAKSGPRGQRAVDERRKLHCCLPSSISLR
jgi:hypothetical protein